MAARRCSLCAISYPIGVGICHVCGGPTSEMSSEQPHENWVVLVEELKAAQAEPLTEIDRVEFWRMQELIRAGYSIDHAEQIAARLDVDLHRAVDLVVAGCPVALAAEILL